MELKELKKLQSYFEEKNIVKLYISIDNKEDIEKAVMMIQKDSLDGYFISYHPPKEQNTRSSFPKEIETLFMTDEHGNPSITIPTYAIVNKKGEIVEKRIRVRYNRRCAANGFASAVFRQHLATRQPIRS